MGSYLPGRRLTTYELWAQRWTNEIYAVRLNIGAVTGVCGPLPVMDAREVGDLRRLEYDGRPEAIYYAQEHAEQFALAEPWLRGRDVPVRS